MKKLVMAALLIATASFAQAIDNSAQAWAFRRDECRWVADMAGDAYDARMNGKEIHVPEKAKNSANGAVYEWTNEYAQGRIGNGALSKREAMTTSYAKCLDNVDSAFLMERSGLHLAVDRLR